MVIAGSGAVHTLTASGFRVTPLEPGAFVWFTPGTIHRLVNGGGLEILVLMANAGLPEAGDLVITFPPEIVVGRRRVRHGGDACRTTIARRLVPGASARQRRDLAVPTFLDLVAATERGDPQPLRTFHRRGGRARATSRSPTSRSCGATARSRPSTRTEAQLAALASGASDHLAAASVHAMPVPDAERRLGCCGTLGTYVDRWLSERHRMGRRRRGTRGAGCCGTRPGRSTTTAWRRGRRTWSRSPPGTRSGSWPGATSPAPNVCSRSCASCSTTRPAQCGTAPSPGSPSGREPPSTGAVEWVDYDPNWRQFLGTTFAVILETFAVSPAVGARLREAIDRAIAGEPRDRVSPSYSNIALMKAWLERDEVFAASVVDCFDEHGAFEEYGSPTYYGIDLYALALWRRYPPTPMFADWGDRLWIGAVARHRTLVASAACATCAARTAAPTGWT